MENPTDDIPAGTSGAGNTAKPGKLKKFLGT